MPKKSPRPPAKITHVTVVVSGPQYYSPVTPDGYEELKHFFADIGYGVNSLKVSHDAPRQTPAEKRMEKALRGVCHHNAASKSEYKLPSSLMREIIKALGE